MTSSPKKHREIRIDSVTYHWTPGETDEDRVTVQHGSVAGVKLVIDPIGPMVAEDVAQGIRYALSQGWHPTAPGPVFSIGFHEAMTEPDRFVRLAEPDEPNWKNVCQWNSDLDGD